MDLKDVGDEVIVDDGENDIALEDEGDNNIVPDDDVEEEENITVTDGNTTRVSMDVTWLSEELPREQCPTQLHQEVTELGTQQSLLIQRRRM